MALIVRSPEVSLEGRQLDIGEIIPKEYENDPDRDWKPAISLGRVDRIPDGAVDGEIPERFGESTESQAKILNRPVSSDEQKDLKDGLEQISDLDSLEKLLQIEKNNKNRTTAIDAIEERQEELLDILSGEG